MQGEMPCPLHSEDIEAFSNIFYCFKMEMYILEGKKPKKVSDMVAWGKYMSGNRHVGDDTINDVRISTVFLGLDHSFGEGLPLLFETMIFGGEHDLYQERYTDYDEAEKRHREIVEIVKNGGILD